MNDAERFELVCQPQLARIEKLVAEMHHTVYQGNGRPALTTQVAQHDADLKDIKATMRRVVAWACVVSSGATAGASKLLAILFG